ncbi:MAG: hypothetical protein ACOYI8_01675 [Christensenellales bacterium]|jgi:hypothetical protein
MGNTQKNNRPKRKWRFGDRNDGRLLRTLDPMAKIAVYIMPNRNDACNFFRGSMDMTEVDSYVREKRAQGLKNFTSTHVFIAAYARTVSQRPALNRFIAGQKVFQRYVFQVELCIKKEMSLQGQESVITMDIPLDATAEQVYEIMEREVNTARKETTDFDRLAKYIDYIPGLLKKFTVFSLRVADYFGLLPMWLKNLSPFHGSMFITSMASLGIPAIYHHIYNFGNVPVFISIGITEKKHVIDMDGNDRVRLMMDYTAVLDERICDGYYYASAFRYLTGVMRRPEQLDTPPEAIVEDID